MSKKKINEDTSAPFKIVDNVKVLNSPILKVTDTFNGFPEEKYGGIEGLDDTIKKNYTKHDLTGWWIETNNKYIYPAFGMEKAAYSISEDEKMTEVYYGYDNPNKAPVKVGDDVINVNVMKPKTLKVLQVGYGSPSKLKADFKATDEQVKSLFGDGGLKMWWIVIKARNAWSYEKVGSADEKEGTTTIAVPYGEDGFIKVSDAKLEENVLSKNK